MGMMENMTKAVTKPFTQAAKVTGKATNQALGDQISGWGPKWGDAVRGSAKKWTSDPMGTAQDWTTRGIGIGLETFANPMLPGVDLASLPFGGTGGMAGNTLWGSKTKKNAAWGDPGGANAGRALDEQNAQDAADVKAEQDRIAKNVKDTGAVYGFGSSPEAQENARRIGDIVGSQVTGAGGQQAGAMSQELYDQLQQLNTMFARSGMTGSGMEQQGIQDAIAQYGARRGGLGTNLEQMRQSLYDTLRSRSQGAQEAVASGGNITQDMALRDQINTINQAMSSSGLNSALNGGAGAVNQTSNALLARAGGANPAALKKALQGMGYDYNTDTEG